MYSHPSRIKETDILPKSLLLILIFECVITIETTKIHMVSWVHNKPYYLAKYNGMTLPISYRGIVARMLSTELLGSCDDGQNTTDIQDMHHLQTHQELIDLITATNVSYVLNKLNLTELKHNEIVVISATTYSKVYNTAPFYQRKIVLKTKPVIVTFSGNLLLLIKFLDGIKPCFIILYFGSSVAVVVAAVIWVFEAWAGNPDFPKTFGKGLWTSFWFCFVTMSTVGYGDKVPKHFISRIICIAWMVFGITLVAVITASIMGSISNVIRRENQNIAVLRNSIEEKIVDHQLFAKPVPMDNYDDIISAVMKNEVPAALLDQNVAVFFFEKHIKELRMERELPVNMKVRAFILYPNNSICKNTQSDEAEVKDDIMDDIKLDFIPPKEINQFFIRTMEDSFDGRDKGLIAYTTILSASLIVLGVICEVYKAIVTHLQTAKIQKRDLLSEFRESPEYKEMRDTQASLQELMNDMVNKAVKRFNARNKTKLLPKETEGVINVNLDTRL